MSDAATPPSREEEMLARLAELDLAAAEKAHAKLMAAEESAEIAEMSRAYQRMSRSLRQTLALKAKLAREREAAARAAPKPDRAPVDFRPLTPRVQAHIDRVHAAVMPYLEREDELPDYDDLEEAEVYEILVDLADNPNFLDTPVEALVAEVLEIMGVPTPLAAPLEPDAEPAPAVQNSA